MKKAYLIATIVAPKEGQLPYVIHVDIYNKAYWNVESLRADYHYAELHVTEGEDYDAAQRAMVDYIAGSEHRKWVRPFLRQLFPAG